MYISAINSVHKSFRGNLQSENSQPNIPKDVFRYVKYDTIKPNYLCPNDLNDINRKLRYMEVADKIEWYNKLTENENEIINAVDEAFEKLPGLNEDRVFFRALSGLDLPKYIRNADKGDVIIPDKGYAQVGLSKYYAEKYLPSEDYDPVLFEIKCPKGSKVSLSKATGTGYEEGMLQRGAKFKILSKEKVNMPIITPSWDVEGAYNKEDRMATKFVLELIHHAEV